MKFQNRSKNFNVFIKNKDDKNDLLFVWSLVCYTILKPIIILIPNQSTSFLLLNFLIIIIYSLKINNFKFSKYNVQAILFIIVLFIIQFFNIFFTYNSYSFHNIINYIIYGILPIYLASNITCFKNIINYFCYFSIVTFFIYFCEPFFDYPMTGDYMSYGFNGMLPAFIGISLLRYTSKKKYLFLLQIIALICLLLFANKSSFLAAISYIIICEIFIKKNSFKKIFSHLIFLLLVGYLFYNIVSILLFIKTLLQGYNYSSYSINTLLSFFKDGHNTSMMSRNVLYENAQVLINNNLLFGTGIGYFESLYGSYSHNIIFDLLLNNGFIGLVSVLTLFFNTFFKMFRINKYIFSFLLTCISLLIPLFFSSTYYKTSYFWIFIFIGLISNKFRKVNINA